MHKPLVNIADASAETIGLLVALGYLVITEDGIHVNEKNPYTDRQIIVGKRN